MKPAVPRGEAPFRWSPAARAPRSTLDRPVARRLRRHAVGSTAVLAVCMLIGIRPAVASGWIGGLAASSSAQAHAEALPAAPTGVTATCTSTIGNTIQVSWTSVLHATGYTIEESTTSASAGYAVAASGVTSTTWTSSALATGSYWFEVIANKGSNWTSPASAATTQRTIAIAACL